MKATSYPILRFTFLIFVTLGLQANEEKIPRNYTSVLMVSFSNLCRSPIAAAVFNDIAKKKGIDSKWYCDSAGIHTRIYSEKSMDPRALSTLRGHGIEPANHTVRMVVEEDFDKFDYIFAMDGPNLADLLNRKSWWRKKSKTKVELLSSYDPEKSSIVRFPYYDRGMGGFEESYEIANRSCNAFLEMHSKSKP